MEKILPTTKIHWGQIFAVFAIILLSLCAATQWTAWRLGFQAELGQLWLEPLKGFPVYFPLIVFWWWRLARFPKMPIRNHYHHTGDRN